MKNTSTQPHPENGKKLARISRDKEFLTTYKAALAHLIESKVKNPKLLAVRWTILNSSPHYHVSYERAYKVICHILRHNELPIKPSLQACMWNEIAQRVKALTGNGITSISKALELVLTHCRASRFFISEHYAYASILPRSRRERTGMPRKIANQY